MASDSLVPDPEEAPSAKRTTRPLIQSETKTTYRWHEVESAPNAPGLYAWYLDPRLRAADLDDAERTTQNLLQLAEWVRLAGLDVSADGHLSLQFTGRLEHQSVCWQEDKPFTDLVSEVLSDPDHRACFAELLSVSSPLFASPLYIGVATSLRVRLAQHKEAIMKYAAVQHGPDGHSFAGEIQKRGIPQNRLVVHCMTAEGLKFSDLDRETRRKVAEAVESALNRMYFPAFGRR